MNSPNSTPKSSSYFWMRLRELGRCVLRMASAAAPQSDGQRKPENDAYVLFVRTFY